MKKLYSLFLSAMMMVLASCTQEDLSKLSVGEEVNMQVSMQIPTVQRAAHTDPTVNAMRVYLIISQEGQIVKVDSLMNVSQNPINFNVRLVTGQSYDFAAWADFGADYYTVNTAEGKVSMKLGEGNTITGSDNKRDAYYGVVKAVSDVSDGISITLKRPFGLVKVVTQDYDEPTVGTLGLTSYSTTINMPTALNLLDGNAGTPEDVLISASFADMATGELSYDYIFATAQKELITFNMDYKDVDGTTQVSYNFTDIPLQRNYKTNISGNILTKQGDVTVTIDQSWTATYGSAALQSVAANGGEITLTEDCIFTNQQYVVDPGAGKTVIINLNGKTIKSDNPNLDAIQVHSGTLIINGDGNIGGVNGYYAIWAMGDSKVILNGGNYYGNGSCIQTKDNAVVEINGGYYKVGQAYNGVYFVVNLQDNQPNTAIIKGGQFENFNPADTNTEPAGVNDNFVPEGYTSTQISTDPIVYEVTENN